MSGPGSGYHVDPGGLDSLASGLHGGADAFNGLASLAPAAPDCGASTELVAQAIAKLVGASAALGGALDGHGRQNPPGQRASYGDIENAATRTMGGTRGPI